MIWPRFNTKLNGFIALIWLLIGLAATNLLRFHYGVSFSLFGFILWLFFVWFGPVLLLAFSALGMGSVDRVHFSGPVHELVLGHG
jgi:hypothetical protein